MPANPAHKGATREEFERFQCERPIMLCRFATRLEAWRDCDRKECRRGKACAGPNGAACIGRFIQGTLSEEERATCHEALRLRGAGLGAEAAWEEAERRVARHQTQIEAIGGGSG